MQWSDGASYQGQWVEGKADGYGRFIYPNGDQYMGSYKNDKANGWGVMHKNDPELGPIILEGQYKDDILHGFGKIKMIKEDTVYEGEIFFGKKEGWGILYWSDSSILEGHWQNGKINGLVRLFALFSVGSIRLV